jgi:hypothetical protein
LVHLERQRGTSILTLAVELVGCLERCVDSIAANHLQYLIRDRVIDS